MSCERELRRPANIMAIVGIAASGLISLYFYNSSERAGEISIRVDQVQVFDKNRMGELPLRLLDATGAIITNNVYAANVSVWNSGTAEIKESDIRKPFRIQIGTGLRALELTPIKYTNDNLDHFRLTSEGVLTWEHFDSGEGLKIRVVYAYDSEQPISLVGMAAGIKMINQPSTERAKGLASSLSALQIALGMAASLYFSSVS